MAVLNEGKISTFVGLFFFYTSYFRGIMYRQAQRYIVVLATWSVTQHPALRVEAKYDSPARRTYSAGHYVRPSLLYGANHK